MFETPTDKQINRIQRMEDYLGRGKVEDYFYKHFPRGDYANKTKKQAQKVITGLSSQMPACESKYPTAISMYYLYGRDD